VKKFLIVLFCVINAYAFSIELAGVYDLFGSNDPSGEIHYIGRVTIVPEGTNYRLDWKIGRQTQVGVGILCDTVLSVSYRNTRDGATGVVSYYITPEGNLEGKWAPLGYSSYGTERLIFKSPL
jgi:hypothetical protein